MKKTVFLLVALVASIAVMATEGALSGKFTINAQGDQVVFSQGNLQATTTDLGENWTWAFATNQWDCVGNAAANNAINGNGTVSANGTVDLFGWSTATSYYGIHNSKDADQYSGDFEDWGNNMGEGWRTLSYDEWDYLLHSRTNALNLHGNATVNGVHGYIFLSDSWTPPIGLSFQTKPNNWTTNQYSGEDWTAMQDAGAVFLPAAGYRYDGVYMVSNSGQYWSSHPDHATSAEGVAFGNGGAHMFSDGFRGSGSSVRLVQAAPQGATDIDNTTVTPNAAKRIVDGQLLIERDGKVFNATGAQVK